MIRLRLPAQQAKPGPPLSPILGQHQIKVAEFVTQFNAASVDWTPGTLLGVRIHKKGTTWRLEVLPPGGATLLGALQVDRILAREDLWVATAGVPHRVRTLLGTLKSLGWGVK